MNKFSFLALILVLLACKTEPTIDYINLIGDSEMSLLEKRGGNADYELKNGILTGSAKMGTHNTFLCTKEHFSDFILDFKVSIDPRLNSGVQIRSQAFDYNGKEAIKGYQVEIDPSDRAWSGGIYEESDRGWICNLANNESGRSAFQNGKWNAYHIEAIGKSIKVWVNGINTANMLDSLCVTGLIGFQVHSIGDSSMIGTQVSWKDIHLYTKNLDKYKFKNTGLAPEQNLLINQLSTQEEKDGWTLISNNTFNSSANLPKGWTVEGNDLCHSEKILAPLTISDVGSDFELKLEYTIEKGGKGSIVYGQDTNNEDVLEYVISDDNNAFTILEENQKAGALKNKIVPRNLSIIGRDKALRSYDQWSQVHIKVNGPVIKHWLNHNLVVDNTNQMKVETKSTNTIKINPGLFNACVRSIKLKKGK